MKNRKILYGYTIENGTFAIHPQEAKIVKRIFEIYQLGESYQQISDLLNAENIPYSEDSASWNKHKIKRMLENPRYTGKCGYLEIIQSEDFQAVQAIIRSKTAGKKQNRASREQNIQMQLELHQKIEMQEYQPSDEVFKLENVIRREMENPNNPQEIVQLILKAASARYDCLK